MPLYTAIREEILSQVPEPPYQVVLKKYLKKLARHTKRAVIIYASSFSSDSLAPYASWISQRDLACVAAATGSKEKELDLILHSPGGSVETAEQLVRYLRRRYTNIRVLVPLSALSTATLLCCGADRLVMSEAAALGPIDPLVAWSDRGTAYRAASRNILSEVALAARSVREAGHGSASQTTTGVTFPPGLLVQCRDETIVARKLATELLANRLLRSDEKKTEKAAEIAAWLANASQLGSSRRPITFGALRGKGIPVEVLEEDDALCENVMSVFYSALAAFELAGCTKIIENHAGNGCSMIAGQTDLHTV